MKTMKRTVTLLLAAVMIAVLAGCGGSKEASSSSDEPITIALSPWPGWFFWYLVDEKGFFDKHGVKVDLKWFPVYSDSLQALWQQAKSTRTAKR